MLPFQLSEAGENESMVSSKADLADEEPDIENRIDPETIDSDEMEDDDVYYDASNTSDDENKDKDNEPSEEEDVPLIEEGRTQSGRSYRESVKSRYQRFAIICSLIYSN